MRTRRGSAAAGASVAEPGYGAVAKLLHWLVAGLVLGLLVLGKTMTGLVSDLALTVSLYQWHKSFGFLVLAVMLARIAWRLAHAPPPLPEAMPRWEARLAHLTHGVLYLLLVSIPLLGWAHISTSSFQIPTVLFGVLPIPRLPVISELAPQSRQLVEGWARTLHALLANTLAVLIVLHVAAALRHHVLLRDDVLRRMLPGRRGSALLLGVALAGAVLAMPGAGRAEAILWQVDHAGSKLSYAVLAGGQPLSGVFGRFTANIVLDPAAPESATVDVEIDVTSLKSENPRADQLLASADWLDTGRYPKARFLAKGASRNADGSLAFAGTLTLKGLDKPALLTVTLTIAGKTAAAKGETVIIRSDFGIGGGAANRAVAPEVRVVLEVVATGN